MGYCMILAFLRLDWHLDFAHVYTNERIKRMVQ